MFRQEVGSLLVLRLSPATPDGASISKSGEQSMLSKLIQCSPDCVVVTDIDGSIVSANDSFIDLVQVPNEKQVRGQCGQGGKGLTRLHACTASSTGKSFCIRPFLWVLRASIFWLWAAARLSRYDRQEQQDHKYSAVFAKTLNARFRE